ncbi:DoxX family protein [Halomonas urumqiensis]|uniref:GntR family transcriptional regulator n=1 Tax=Halomonas urumqiensis TaxID=1684789 RepID=A0A2N7UEV1_9GAMM|nr:DoxX family protein [Halomonas urumqiensis]PMR78979.1 GntR family transcriptional regulator [Halomonas urumqiensis]PTB00973.1 DoxX family protein [Halomonas urumqiensis]GHE22916.1 GntR family transcriptional regulator [Halomonas urumqiensis]
MLHALHNDALGKLVLRLSVGGLMLLHGIAKLTNPGSLTWIGNTLEGQGLPSFLAYGVLLGEIVAPLMAIIGLQTRLAGLIMAVNMLMAIFLAHRGELMALNGNGGWALELQGLFLFGALAIMLMGSGRMAYRPD